MTLKKLILTMAFLGACLSGRAEKVLFVPQYRVQSQFAGYYVALEKGFYADEGLDVRVRHIGNGANENAADLLINGQAQIVGAQLIQSIEKRSRGASLVNVFQLTQKMGLCCVCSSPIKSFLDLDGMKISRSSIGFSEVCDMLEKTEGTDIEWIPAFNPVNLFIYGAVDGVIVYSYNELIQLKQSIGSIPPENIIRFSDDPIIDFPEDGLYVTEEYYRKNRETVEKFIRATKKGWDYTREHIDEALDISWKQIQNNHVITNRSKEREMLEEYLRLQINPRTGLPDYASISPEELDRLISLMVACGALPEAIDTKDFIK